MKESSSSSPMAMAYLAELRKESPASSVGFSDPCPCCGNLKRRCLYDSSAPRKKILVFDLNSPSSSAAAVTPSSDLTSEALPAQEAKRTKPALEDSGSFKIRRSPELKSPPPAAAPSKSPPMEEAKAEQPPASGSGSVGNGKGGSLGAARVLERSNSTASSPKTVPCSAEQDKGRGGAHGEVEVRVGVKCKCGIVREIVLIQ